MRFTALLETRLNPATRDIGDLEIKKIWEVQEVRMVRTGQEVQEIYRETCVEGVGM
jgi:hypothetical protein